MNEQQTFILNYVTSRLALGFPIATIKNECLKIFPAEVVEATLKSFLEELEQSFSRSTKVLKGVPSSTKLVWTGTSRFDVSLWTLLKENLEFKQYWSPEMVTSLDRSSTIVANSLSSPSSPTAQTKGLVIGYVQSGKTANISAVIAKAVDSGYRMVVVFSGLHNNLRHQTERRLFRELCEPDLSRVINLTRVDANGDFSKTQAVRAETALRRDDGFSLAVLKKNSKVLRNFISWLKESKEEHIRSCSLLLIDDEADHASVNTAKLDDDPSAINRLLRELLGLFENYSYVGYTATPFANILIDSSKEEDLYPRDFIISLEKPPSYFGAEELFGSEILTGEKLLKSQPLVRIVPAVEPEKAVPDSLRRAISNFVVAGALRLSRQQQDQNITMLIHITNLVAEHRNLFEAVKELVLDWVNDFDSRIASEDVSSIFSEYLKTSELMGQHISCSDDAFKKNLKRFVENLEVIMDNSGSDERLSFVRDRPLWAIVIGGNTLSRGLTIEGLTTSYFARGSKSYDTLLQMGRWFGYRPGYIDLTRIFVPKTLKDRFLHLAVVETELREEIHAMADNNETPANFALKIKDHPVMSVTSNLKMRTATPASLSYSGSKLQTRYLSLENDTQLKRNQESVAQLVQNVLRTSQVSTSDFSNFKGFKLFRNVPSEVALQFVDGYEFSKADIRFDKDALRRYIQEGNNLRELSSWNVCFVSSFDGAILNSLDSSIEIRSIKRTLVPHRSERDPSALNLKALTPPVDELVDIQPVEKVSTKGDSAENYLKRLGISATAVRQKYRTTSQPLLMIYPLGRLVEVENDMGESAPKELAYDAFGVMFAFPRSEKIKAVFNYVLNGSV